jgi:hypothetical protein
MMHASIQLQPDATHVNSILNHPEVHPWVARDSTTLDLSPIIGHPDVVALFADKGGQVYQRLLPSLWEAHSAFLPEGRGDYALSVTRATLAWMFTRTDACEIVTRVPHGNLAAKALARSISGQLEFTIPGGWVKDGSPIDADLFSLSVQGWMRSAPDLIDRGRWFHDRLEAELDRLGIKEGKHDQSDVHDRYVGAAVEMFFGGQPLKGAVLYNRIAAVMGWQPVAVLSLDPIVVDIGSARLVMRGDDFIALPPQRRDAA